MKIYCSRSDKNKFAPYVGKDIWVRVSVPTYGNFTPESFYIRVISLRTPEHSNAWMTYNRVEDYLVETDYIGVLQEEIDDILTQEFTTYTSHINIEGEALSTEELIDLLKGSVS